MNNLKQNIDEIILLISETTDFFYQQKDKEGYDKLNITLGKLMDFTIQLQNHLEDLDFDNDKFNSDLMEVMNSLETKDTVMLSDILVYEITEQLQGIKEQL